MNLSEEWVVRSVVGAIVAAVVGLFVRMRKLEARREAADVRLEHLEGRGTGAAQVDDLSREIQDLKVCIARNYIRREDWVPTMSRILGALEKQGELLARVDERQRRRHDG